jgi:CrcB protein
VKDFLVISVAAVVGANLRYLLGRAALHQFGPAFPYGTLVINVLGSFVVGYFVMWAAGRAVVDPRWRLLVVIGFCGSFTTFSGYAYDTVAYFQRGEWGLMLANIFANNLLCMAGVLAGMGLARVIALP